MTDSGNTWRLRYWPALDGLRGIAVLLVLIAHFGIRNVNPTSTGTVGVTVFFTLSGFLITSLLLEESTRRGRVNRKAFYLRRALRLVPALLTCIALAVVLELATLGRVTDPDMIVGSLTYTANFAMADGRWGDPTFLGHMWSLAIEEQFYLVWPLAVALLVRLTRSRALLVLGYASMAAVLLRALMWDGGEGKTRLWMGTDTRSDAILIGCLLASALHGRPARVSNRWWAIGGGVMLAAFVPWRLNMSEQSTAVTTPLLAALAAACLIYSVATSERHPVLASSVLRWVGVRSYGIYLYHAPIVTAVHITRGESMLTAWLIALPATLVAAELSWRYVEQPFLRRKARLTPDQTVPTIRAVQMAPHT